MSLQIGHSRNLGSIFYVPYLEYALDVVELAPARLEQDPRPVRDLVQVLPQSGAP